MIEHYYEKIPGWFDFQDLYSEAVRTARDGAVFVEIGNWVGRSLVYLGTEIARSSKRIKLVSCDPCTLVAENKEWDGEDNSEATRAYRESLRLYGGRRLADVLEDNMAPIFSDQSNRHNPLWIHYESKGVDIVWAFDERVCDFVFIDGDHSYEGCLADLRAWWPKVKVGGRIAGHDHTHDFPGVIRAVSEFFGPEGGCGEVVGYRVNVSKSSFYVDKIAP